MACLRVVIQLMAMGWDQFHLGSRGAHCRCQFMRLTRTMPVYPANGIPSQLDVVVVDNNSLVSSGVTMDGSRNYVQNGVEG